MEGWKEEMAADGVGGEMVEGMVEGWNVETAAEGEVEGWVVETATEGKGELEGWSFVRTRHHRRYPGLPLPCR